MNDFYFPFSIFENEPFFNWPSFFIPRWQAIYEYELQRKYQIRPDLSDLIIHYDHLDPNDKRPMIKDVDN